MTDVLKKMDWVLDEIGKSLNAEVASPSPLERESEGEVQKIKITSSILEIGGEKDLDKGFKKPSMQKILLAELLNVAQQDCRLD